MALSKIKGTVIADDAINADRIADGTVVASDLLDNTITGAKLATDIAITTSGNITTTGALTSTGIDDNATATAITIDSSQNVGIGTSSPSAKLEAIGVVKTSDGGTQGIAIASTGFIEIARTAGTAFIDFKTSTSEDYDVRIQQLSNGLSFQTGGNGSASERMRIDSSGNVGIGTSSPSQNLEVSSSTTTFIKSKTTAGAGIGGFQAFNNGSTEIKLFSYGTAYSGTTFGGVANANLALLESQGASNLVFSTWSNAGGSNPDILFTPQRNLKLIIKDSGNVGIGTSSPDSLLHLTSTAPVIRLEDTDAGGGYHQLGNSASDGTLVIYADADGTNSSTANLRFSVSGSERMRIDSSGNVGIGTSSPDDILQINTSSPSTTDYESGEGITVNNTDTATGTITPIGFGWSGATGSLRRLWGMGMITDNLGNGYAHLGLYVGDNERIRINRYGNTGIGDTGHGTIKLSVTGNGGSNTTAMQISQNIDSLTTVADPLIIQNRVTGTGSGVGHGVAIRFNGERNDGNAQVFGRVGFDAKTNSGTSLETDFFVRRYLDTEIFRVNDDGRITRNKDSLASAHGNFVGEVGSSYKALSFSRTNGGSEVGNVVANTSSTSYNTTSDYRLKENVVDLTNATERLKQLQPKRFNFIADANTTVDGFLAHEVSSIVPEAISGEKDAVDENGNPEYQGIDQSKLVPLLVKTIQELEARITALEANNP